MFPACGWLLYAEMVCFKAAGCSDVESKRAPKAKQLEDVLDLPPSTNDDGEGMVRVPTAGFRQAPLAKTLAPPHGTRQIGKL